MGGVGRGEGGWRHGPQRVQRREAHPGRNAATASLDSHAAASRPRTARRWWSGTERSLSRSRMLAGWRSGLLASSWPGSWACTRSWTVMRRSGAEAGLRARAGNERLGSRAERQAAGRAAAAAAVAAAAVAVRLAGSLRVLRAPTRSRGTLRQLWGELCSAPTCRQPFRSNPWRPLPAGPSSCCVSIGAKRC